ncbi:hypothetical protein [Secundilactobacillus folii]|uniref:Sugar specific permease n=1 Tax=Secundilactobacillus folii TaxID=2678357 RepID=A0A7X2XVB0_9LACO|nr:hypothetical protein [Secundilactobacillus folii]MTV81598.1 hypothetical protein [Secundilactobacillus folii]
MGSGLWTASAVNLNNWTGVSLGLLLFFIGVINAITNQVLIHHFDGKRLVGEIVYVAFFGTIVQYSAQLFEALGVGRTPVIMRLIFSCLGIVLFCIGISLYQRANIIMHPNDDTTNILRFLYLKGNATASQLLDFVPPAVVIIITFFATKQILSVNLATLFSIFGNGILIATSDQWIWPHLTHNFRAKPVHG